MVVDSVWEGDTSWRQDCHQIPFSSTYPPAFDADFPSHSHLDTHHSWLFIEGNHHPCAARGLRWAFPMPASDDLPLLLSFQSRSSDLV